MDQDEEFRAFIAGLPSLNNNSDNILDDDPSNNWINVYGGPDEVNNMAPQQNEPLQPQLQEPGPQGGRVPQPVDDDLRNLFPDHSEELINRIQLNLDDFDKILDGDPDDLDNITSQQNEPLQAQAQQFGPQGGEVQQPVDDNSNNIVGGNPVEVNNIVSQQSEPIQPQPQPQPNTSNNNNNPDNILDDDPNTYWVNLYGGPDEANNIVRQQNEPLQSHPQQPEEQGGQVQQPVDDNLGTIPDGDPEDLNNVTPQHNDQLQPQAQEPGIQDGQVQQRADNNVEDIHRGYTDELLSVGLPPLQPQAQRTVPQDNQIPPLGNVNFPHPNEAAQLHVHRHEPVAEVERNVEHGEQNLNKRELGVEEGDLVGQHFTGDAEAGEPQDGVGRYFIGDEELPEDNVGQYFIGDEEAGEPQDAIGQHFTGDAEAGESQDMVDQHLTAAKKAGEPQDGVGQYSIGDEELPEDNVVQYLIGGVGAGEQENQQAHQSEACYAGEPEEVQVNEAQQHADDAAEPQVDEPEERHDGNQNERANVYVHYNEQQTEIQGAPLEGDEAASAAREDSGGVNLIHLLQPQSLDVANPMPENLLTSTVEHDSEHIGTLQWMASLLPDTVAEEDIQQGAFAFQYPPNIESGQSMHFTSVGFSPMLTQMRISSMGCDEFEKAIDVPRLPSLYEEMDPGFQRQGTEAIPWTVEESNSSTLVNISKDVVVDEQLSFISSDNLFNHLFRLSRNSFLQREEGAHLELLSNFMSMRRIKGAIQFELEAKEMIIWLETNFSPENLPQLAQNLVNSIDQTVAIRYLVAKAKGCFSPDQVEMNLLGAFYSLMSVHRDVMDSNKALAAVKKQVDQSIKESKARIKNAGMNTPKAKYGKQITRSAAKVMARENGMIATFSGTRWLFVESGDAHYAYGCSVLQATQEVQNEVQEKTKQKMKDLRYQLLHLGRQAVDEDEEYPELPDDIVERRQELVEKYEAEQIRPVSSVENTILNSFSETMRELAKITVRRLFVNIGGMIPKGFGEVLLTKEKEIEEARGIGNMEGMVIGDIVKLRDVVEKETAKNENTKNLMERKQAYDNECRRIIDEINRRAAPSNSGAGPSGSAQ